MVCLYITVSTGSSGVIQLFPPLNLVNLTCSEDFLESNFTCLPRCDRWEEKSHIVVIWYEMVRVFTAVVKLMASSLLIGIFIIRYKTL